MRQFVLANAFVTGDAIATAKSGNIYIKEQDNGCHNLVLVRDAAKGGNILYPIYAKDMSVVKSQPANVAGTVFTATFTIPEVSPYLIYTVLFTKKGAAFNERANWTASFKANGADTAETIASKVVTFVKNNPTLGLTAEAAGETITFTAVTAGDDYVIKGSDDIFAVEAITTQTAKAPWMDAAMIKDLFAKCAADAGFEYTYDELDGLYPSYDFNPLAGADTVDGGFVVYTIRFTEPRLMGTREEAVYQIVQVAFPTGKDTGFEAAINEFVVDVR